MQINSQSFPGSFKLTLLLAWNSLLFSDVSAIFTRSSSFQLEIPCIATQKIYLLNKFKFCFILAVTATVLHTY